MCRGQCLSIVRIDVVNVRGGAGRVLAVGYCKPQPPPPSLLLDLRYCTYLHVQCELRY